MEIIGYVNDIIDEMTLTALTSPWQFAAIAIVAGLIGWKFSPASLLVIALGVLLVVTAFTWSLGFHTPFLALMITTFFVALIAVLFGWLAQPRSRQEKDPMSTSKPRRR